MSKVTVSQDCRMGMTMVSNRFIDEYMKHANDTQVKIYLYLLRVVGTDLPSGISDIADYFNHTEKDVIRALKYWDKLHVLTLLYNDAQEIQGIRLEDLDSMPPKEDGLVPSVSAQSVSMQPGSVQPGSVSSLSAQSESVRSISSVPITVAFSTQLPSPAERSVRKPELAEDASFPDISAKDAFKSSITRDQLKAFKNREETPELIFIIEQYLGRPLSQADTHSIYFLTDGLHFSTDLIDYLVQYCVERGKKDFRYIESVAMSWDKEGITTPKQAAAHVKKYEKNVYTIMKCLGKSGAPTDGEVEYVNRWIKEYGFSLDIIKEACQRTVMATDHHRFEYAERILKSWYQSSVHSLKDIASADEAFQRKKNSMTASAKTTVNAFNQFKQNQYDYDDLLEKMKVN